MHSDARWCVAAFALVGAIAAVGCSSATPDADAPASVMPRSARPTNELASFLQEAECQAENDEQRANVRTALDDLATLPVEKLRERRYDNYTGQPGQWDLRTLLKRHLVPYPMQDLPEHEAFWRAVDSDDVRKLADAACR